MGEIKEVVLEGETFEGYIGRIASESSDFNDFLNNVSTWMGIDKEFFRRIIEGALTLEGKITWKQLQNQGVISEDDKRSIEQACKQKASIIGVKIVGLRDVIIGCAQKQNLFKEVKMQKMRESYKKMVGEKDSGKSLSADEERQLREDISAFSKRAQDIKGQGRDKVIRFVSDVAKKIKDLNEKRIILSVETAEEHLRKFFTSKEFNYIAKATFEMDAAWYSELRQAKRTAMIFWANAIDNEYRHTQDIGRLEELFKMIPKEMASENSLIIGRTRENIHEKIRTLKHKEASQRLSPSMEALTTGIVSEGEFDIQQANVIITEEAEQQAKLAKPSRIPSLTLTPERARGQIIQNLLNRIKEGSDNCRITVQPSEVITRLEALKTNPILAAEAIISNLVGEERFTTAEMLCTTLERKNKFDKVRIDSWRKSVSNAKVANLFLSGMNGDRTAQDEQTDYILIEGMIQRREIEPKYVKLGTRPDGTTITLADILSDEAVVSR